MVNDKFAVSRSKSPNGDRVGLPPDFGSMYFLYPTESVDFFKFKPAGLVDKLVRAVKEKWRNSDSDVEYYKNYGG